MKAHPRSQAGLALFIVLVFLMILTMLALTTMQGATLGERIARNQSDYSLANQAAEAALRDAELDLRTLRADGSLCVPAMPGCRAAAGYAPWRNGHPFKPACPEGLCDGGATEQLAIKLWEPDSSLWANAVDYGRYTQPVGGAGRRLPGVSRQPHYLIEKFDMQDGGEIGVPALYYRITARGYGALPDTLVVLQSIYRPLPPF